MLKPTEKVNVLIEGPVGTGKTTSIKTILTETNKELFVLATEPGIHTILNELDAEGKDWGDRFHWASVTPAQVGFDILADAAKQVNTLPLAGLIKSSMHKEKFTQFIQACNTLNNFKCERPGCSCTNKEWGPVEQFGPEKVLVIDGLSGLSIMAQQLVIGARPVSAQDEWQIAQNTLRGFINTCTNNLKCSFVLIAHMDRNEDKVNGGTTLTVSTLGQKLAPDIPKFFDEVIMARRTKEEFFWSTYESGVDLKCRALPIDSALSPTFANFWQKETAS